VPAHPGSPGKKSKRALKWLCMRGCMRGCVRACVFIDKLYLHHRYLNHW